MRTTIDQLVFGYRDGHELLASSVEVDPRTEASLLPHTDARFEDESPHYLVGTPIGGLGRFLLARIWPAEEISRPGAVWAHGLLIEPAVLKRVDPPDLLRLFRRPSNDLGGYREPIEFEARDAQPADLPKSLVLSICWVMYSDPRQGAVVVWPDNVEAETSLLAVWRTQPPSVRVKFSFRTRGRARTGVSPYVLQVATAVGGRSGSDALPILDARRLDPAQVPEWVDLIAEAACDPHSDVAGFIRTFSRSRQSVPELARLWPLVSSDHPVPTEVLRFLQDRFPKPGTMRRLKRALFGDAHNGAWTVDELERVSALLEVGSASFDPRDLKLSARLDGLWDRERRAMVRLLDRHERFAPAEADLLVRTAVLELEAGEIADRAADRRLLDQVVVDRPTVFSDAGFWEKAPSNLWPQLISSALGVVSGRDLVVAMVSTQEDELLRTAQIGGVDPLIVADALARDDPCDLTRWATVFSGRGLDLGLRLASTSRVRAETMLLIAAALPMKQTDMVPLRRWLPPARVAHERNDPAAQTAAARILVRALQSDNESARKLIIECFGPVHLALADRALDPETWAALDKTLPGKKESPPKRLRRALVGSMERTSWTQDDLTRTLRPAGPDAMRIIKLVGKKHPLRRVVEGAAGALVAPLKG